MKDDFGRKIEYLRISVTDLCNLRCVYCMPEEGIVKHNHQTSITFEEIEAIVRAGARQGIHKVRLTGGEPLVRKGIVELVKRVGAINGIDDLSMTTNGILLPKWGQDLKNAGLQRVNISLDTLDSKKYAKITRGGDLEAVFRGIDAAKEAGLAPIKINVVLIEGFNEDEIEAFVNLTVEKALEVRFIELMPLGDQTAFALGQYISGEEVLRRMPALQPVINTCCQGPAKLYRIPGAIGKVGLINPISHSFCSECNRLRLTADAKLRPCLHSDKELSVRELRSEGYTYDEIISMATKMKPETHKILDKETVRERNMNEIGG